VLLFTLGVSLVTGLLFGLGPSLAAARAGAAASLSANARVTTASRSAKLFPKVLVVGQVMLSLLLLVGAGLFLRTLKNLQAQEFGFEREHLLLGEILPLQSGYKSEQMPGLDQALIERLSALPGVRSVSLSNAAPIGSGVWSSSVKITGYTPKPKEDMSAVLNRVSAGYFSTVGVPLVEGRGIERSDSATSLKVAVINEAMARKFFPQGDALGRSVSVDIDSVAGPWRIVGVVKDTKIRSPRDRQARYTVYMPLAQMTGDDAFVTRIEMRTVGDPAKMIGEMRKALAQVDPNLPLTQARTIREQVDSTMSHEELISSLTGVFSVLALVLAAIGLYGVMSYSVVRRTGEIGIRLALGAQAQRVLWMVLRESLVLLGVGMAVGLPLTLMATRAVRQQLYGLSATDPVTIAVAVGIVGGMTVLAAWLPARRAARVDPMVALRCD
jgi:predicted permease